MLDDYSQLDVSDDKQCINGEWVWIVNSIVSDPETGRTRDAVFGILAKDLKLRAERGLISEVAQFFKLVQHGLIKSKHIFEGLYRPLYCDGSDQGDKSKLVYSSKPIYDYEWQRRTRNTIVERSAPKNSVFVTIVSPNANHRGEYPQIEGWVNHWSWVEEDTLLNCAPQNWAERYSRRLWSKENMR